MDETPNPPPTPPQDENIAGLMPDDLEPISPDVDDSDVYLDNENSNAQTDPTTIDPEPETTSDNAIQLNAELVEKKNEDADEMVDNLENKSPMHVDHEDPTDTENKTEKEAVGEDVEMTEIHNDETSEKNAEKYNENDAENDGEMEIEKDEENNEKNDAEKDTENDVEKDTENDVEKDTENDVDKDVENDAVKEAENDAVKDAENDAVKDAENDAVKDAEKDVCEETLAQIVGEGHAANTAPTQEDDTASMAVAQTTTTAAEAAAENPEEDDEDESENDPTINTVSDTTIIDEPMDESNTENHEPEEVNMESLSEPVRDKTIAEDPFDSLMASTLNTSNESTHTAAATTATANTECRTDRDDDTATNVLADDHDDSEAVSCTDETNKDSDATNSSSSVVNKTTEENQSKHQDNEEPVAVDNIEEGQGVDEELSLLPDAEREISDADKQKALLAEEVAAGDVSEVIDVDDEDESINQSHQNNVDKNAGDMATDENDLADANEANQMNENLEILASAPKKDEIKEIQSNFPEQTCIECSTVRLCKYSLLQEADVKYLCEIDCVNTFRTKSSETFVLTVKKVIISQVVDSEQKCIRCSDEKRCKYRYRNADKMLEYVCDDTCLDKLIGKNTEKYVVKRKRYLIEEIGETKEPKTCLHCSQNVQCRFTFKQDDDEFHICGDDCLNFLMKEQPDRFRIKRRSVRVRDLPKRAGSGSATIATEPMVESEPEKPIARTPAEASAARIDRDNSFIRRCAQCCTVVIINEKSLVWETLDFCNEICLGQYQNVIGSVCTTCQNTVTLTSLGKYCVRFGYEIRQFCRAACLDEFKKGLKVCSFCQKDISKNQEGFLASISGQFKDFCSQYCLKRYDEMCNPKKKNNAGICSVCNNVDQIRVEILVDGRDHPFCSNPCFSAFKFVNNIVPDKCAMCSKFFERKSNDAHTIYQDKTAIMFCTKICMNFYIITSRKIVPCQWCKVKKYNFDMIQKYSSTNSVVLCSLNCLTLCEVSMNAISMKKQKCDQCSSVSTPQYHLTMSDASLRNFCTYQCVMSFQSQFSHAPLSFDGDVPPANSPVPTGLPKRIKNTTSTLVNNTATAASVALPPPTTKNAGKQNTTKATATKITRQTKAAGTSTSVGSTKFPVISNVTSLAPPNTRRGGRTANLSMSMQPVVELEPLSPYLLKKTTTATTTTTTSKRGAAAKGTKIQSKSSSPSPGPTRMSTPTPMVETKTQIVTLPALPTVVGNKSTMCKPMIESKEVSCRPEMNTVGSQTDSHLERKIIIPVPVPIYVPQPMYMFSLPLPIPVPFPLPIPVPVFIPTTRNSAPGIMKEIKKIQDKMPTDPFEAELLMMAEMVAGDKKKDESDSDSEDEPPVNDYATESITENNAFGEDMLQMALKMAGEYEEPAVDLESAMTANTITPSNHPHLAGEEVDDPSAMHHHHLMLMEHQRQIQSGRGRKRGSTAMQPRNNRITPPAKRSRRQDVPVMPPQPEPPREPIEKADANMCLKFTFGVNAWKQWVMTKNADLEKSSIKRKPFKSELLQLTADELNYSLCLFVKEVRKPNGSEYAPDTIYYLVLGIQQYLYENGRIDNIFTDPYYERFTDCLDDVAKKFSVLYNDSQYIVTRVEEEHLWECKQLGAHSPHVLLSTLMFFNTKHFNLTTVEEHMQLSFSHIMKHWKRNPNQVGAAKLPGSRNVLLRFYPPQSALDNNSRKKKVYEQQENEENPLRCPVKLYEFYLSKCPESVKTRNDVFYLQPERSCVPDSPVWYSTQALGKESLSKMLHRVKMVKEINIALLTS